MRAIVTGRILSQFDFYHYPSILSYYKKIKSSVTWHEIGVTLSNTLPHSELIKLSFLINKKGINMKLLLLSFQLFHHLLEPLSLSLRRLI